jgi:general L-amino acid transport system substrate-binding protein
MLGTEGNLGEMLGLSADWGVNVIAAVGNYGEIFEGNIGENTPIGLARGLNAQWTDGGLLYSPPFR